jgi:hypothetical protein
MKGADLERVQNAIRLIKVSTQQLLLSKDSSKHNLTSFFGNEGMQQFCVVSKCVLESSG